MSDVRDYLFLFQSVFSKHVLNNYNNSREASRFATRWVAHVAFKSKQVTTFIFKAFEAPKFQNALKPKKHIWSQNGLCLNLLGGGICYQNAKTSNTYKT